MKRCLLMCDFNLIFHPKIFLFLAWWMSDKTTLWDLQELHQSLELFFLTCIIKNLWSFLIPQKFFYQKLKLNFKRIHKILQMLKTSIVSTAHWMENVENCKMIKSIIYAPFIHKIPRIMFLDILSFRFHVLEKSVKSFFGKSCEKLLEDSFVCALKSFSMNKGFSSGKKCFPVIRFWWKFPFIEKLFKRFVRFEGKNVFVVKASLVFQCCWRIWNDFWKFR